MGMGDKGKKFTVMYFTIRYFSAPYYMFISGLQFAVAIANCHHYLL
jgi:hypothetical protein